MSTKTPQYAAARLTQALASDPRTAELGVRVQLRGEHVYLVGEVASEERRRHLTEVVHELAPELTVHNEVGVVECREPSTAEELD
ncbi:BON domain [Streptoalloteichus tenebrarius]|uniref:BON domain n=1 Tax=Streptoalloteichus tenebrarius (strain ATCC 17920 / DSM 40477 / JCM 4838 / CBS 697.72 / NBRC 16177 / NCIMB 11028 / NRRL B-12390 / A12253. 1 / ISP 5477) TaxID=1933 RepID=A0ABT1HTC0_STRSD|nr:BON domain-containing protein [Streptoalloteichus tenebrarius]MCP2258768.1 BON domain [Streptoalloteichus tenebrarius]